MGRINLTINGRNYGMECDDGQEERVTSLGTYVESKLKQISAAGAANNELHLLVLTALMIADENYDLRENLAALGDHVESMDLKEKEETMIAQVIEHLSDRVDNLSERLKAA